MTIGYPAVSLPSSRKEGWKLPNFYVLPIFVIPFLLGVYFPYIEVIPTGTDVQPAALLAAIGIVTFYSGRCGLPTAIRGLFLMLCWSLGVLLLSEWNYNALRSISTYASIFFIAAAAYLCSRSRLMSSRWFLDAMNYTWGAVGLVQTLYDREFLRFMLSNQRTTAERGVTSLAAEPSFYGIICFVMLLQYFLERRERSIPALICLMQILFLAKSPTALAVLLLAGAIYLLTHLNMRTVLAVVVLAVIASWAVSVMPDMNQVRLFQLATVAIETPGELLTRDNSATSRFYHILYSFQGAFENFLVPRGFSAWTNYYESEMAQTNNRYLGTLGFFYQAPERIMSALGTAVFELGAAGFLIVFAVIQGVRHYFGRLASRRALTFFVSFTLALLNSVPLSFPLYGFLIGYLFAYRDREAA